MKNLTVNLIIMAIILSCAAPSKLQNTSILSENLSGKLSQEKLDAIAKLIRELEQNPLDSKAKDANLILFKWLAESPDISVTLYPFISNAKNLDKDNRGTLMMQMMFSTAGSIIEDPSLKKDKIKATYNGLTRTLSVYEILKTQNSASDPYLDNLIQEKEKNNLYNIVAEVVKADNKK